MATIDFVIHFRGVAPEGAGRMKESDVFPVNLCSRYTANAAGAGRQLVLLGENTKSHDDRTVVDAMMDRMREPLKRDGNTLGKILIYGSSSGGRQALALAGQLSDNNLFAIHYVGIMDAAFFPQETLSKPPEVPRFFIQPFVIADNRENYFQTAGNGSEWGFRAGRKIYSSKMAHKEIHGDVAGLERRDLTDEIRNSSDDYHVACIRLARPRVQSRIAGLLNALVGP